MGMTSGLSGPSGGGSFTGGGIGSAGARKSMGYFILVLSATANAHPPDLYIRVMVKLPFPVQPGLPARIHVPDIVLPLIVPVRVRVFPPGDPDRTLMPNWPETLPLKSPVSANVPLSVSSETKQFEFVVKRKLLMVTDPLFPVACSAVEKANIWVPLVSVSVAVQLPLMLPDCLLLEPQPARVSPNPKLRTTASDFIG